MICKRISMLMAAICAVALSSVAQANLVAGSSLYYTFAGPVAGHDFVVGPGGTVDVRVYLVEDTSVAPSVIVPGDGLFAIEALVEQTSDTTPADPATVTALSELLDGIDEFDGNNTLDLAGPSIIQDHTNAFINGDLLGVLGTVDGNLRSFRIGTFTFTAGQVVGDVTTFHFADIPLPSENTILWALPPTDIGEQISPSHTFTITVIPEPASMTLLALGGLLLVTRRR